MTSTSAELRFDAIGTTWTIELPDVLPSSDRQPLLRQILERIAQYDMNYSRFRSDSLVSKMARRAGRYRLPDDAGPLLTLYRQLYDLTGGQMTPLIGRTLESAGYDADYSLRPRPGGLVAPPEWQSVMSYDPPYLALREPALLDFGAAGKGYLTDIIGNAMQAVGIQDYCINAGGDILCRSTSGRTYDIALEHPNDPTSAIGIAHVMGGSLCGSAGNRRAWQDYHHIISPRTLQSPRHIQALWVSAASGLVADGLATALFFVPPSELARHFEFEYAIVNQDASLIYSPGFPAEFFETDEPSP